MHILAFMVSVFLSLSIYSLMRTNETGLIVAFAIPIFLTIESFPYIIGLRSASYHAKEDSHHKKELGKLLEGKE